MIAELWIIACNNVLAEKLLNIKILNKYSHTINLLTACGLLMPEKAKPTNNEFAAFRRSSSFGPEPLIGGVPLRTAQSSPWMVLITLTNFLQ
jgi:hypothetical protein